MPQDPKKNRVIPQSISVNDDEKLAIEVLAGGEGMKPGTFTRQIFYRGLAAYVVDRKAVPEVPEEEIFAQVMNLIGGDATLTHLKSILTDKREIERSSKAGRVYASGNLADEAGETAGAKKAAGKRNRR